ncbi:MAG: PH domain-containing protein [Verrucomicrobiota bacterium]
MTAEYLIHFPDGTTDGPYTEEELLDMVDADELSAGAVCEDTATGQRMRVRQLFQVIPPAAGKTEPPPGDGGSGPGPAASGSVSPLRSTPTPAPARWVPVPFPENPAARPPPQAPLRTYYRGSPSLLNSSASVLLSVALATGGWYAGRWDGAWLAWGWMAGCALLAAVFFRRSTTEYRVTSRRVEAHTGLFSKISRALPIDGIRSIHVTRKGLKGWVGIGTVVFSSGGAGEDVVFRQIGRARAVGELVRRLQPGESE